MSVLERIMQMKQEGQTDGAIIQSLQQQGISPREINEALSQSQIKSAVGEYNPADEMQPSIMQQSMETQPILASQPFSQNQPQSIQSRYQSSTLPYEGQYSQQPYPEQSELPEQTYEQQAYYPEQPYQEYQNYPSEIETVNEIANQIVEEQTSSLKKQLVGLAKFKEDVLLEIDKINQRLQRIETTIDELQMSIIGKVGEFGKNIENISREMHATQDSFSKILNPLTDNIRELQKITGKHPKSKGKHKAGFEDYIR